MARFDQAGEILDGPLPAVERAYGAQNPRTPPFLATDGRVLIDLHRFAEAEPLLRDTHARALAALGPEHETTRSAAADLARVVALATGSEE